MSYDWSDCWLITGHSHKDYLPLLFVMDTDVGISILRKWYHPSHRGPGQAVEGWAEKVSWNLKHQFWIPALLCGLDKSLNPYLTGLSQ